MSAVVPSTSFRTTVFPWSEQSKTFHTQSYEPDQVSLEEVNQCISEIDAECKLYNENLPGEKPKANFFYSLVMAIMFWDICLFFSDSKNKSLGHFTNGETIFLSWFLFWFLRWLFGLKFEVDSLCQLKDKCQDIIDKHNDSLRSRNLKWYLPDEFPTWIELTKIMEKKNNHLDMLHQVPRSTENTIVFARQYYKSDKDRRKIWRFSQDFFSPDMVAGRISCKEAREFLSEINTCLKTPFEDPSKTPFPIFRCLIVELFVLLYASNHIFSGFLATLLLIIFAVISVIAYFYILGNDMMKEEGGADIQIKERCQTIANKYNQSLRHQGLKWHLPDKFPHWVELHKISQNQDLRGQPIGLSSKGQEPPVESLDDMEARTGSNKRAQNDAYVQLVEDNED